MNSITKHIEDALPIAVIGLVLYALAPSMAQDARGAWLRHELARDVLSFSDALKDARENASVVEIGPRRWAVYQGGKAVRQGDWADGEKVGTNIPGWRVYFDQAGACRTVQGDACATAHAIAITSDVPRIYTIEFDDAGKPMMFQDDF